MEKFSAFGELLKNGGTEMSRKMSEGMSSITDKMRDLIHGQTEADQIVEEATNENKEDPDWALNLEICDMINSGKILSEDAVRALKKRLMQKDPRVQFLSLVLLETCVNNCDKIFPEVAEERILNEMVKLVDDPQTIVSNREKALALIKAWGESSQQLRYLPVFEETYKSLKSRGIRFPGRDYESLTPRVTTLQTVTPEDTDADISGRSFWDAVDPQTHVLSEADAKKAFDVARNTVDLLSTVLTSSPQEEALKDEVTTTLIEQCRQSQLTIQRMVERAGNNEALLSEALNVNDEIQHILTKFEELMKALAPHSNSEQAIAPVKLEEESPCALQEDTSVRDHNPKPLSSQFSISDEDSKADLKHTLGREHNSKNLSLQFSISDEDAMADLDEMIFGKKTETSEVNASKNQKDDDLISF